MKSTLGINAPGTHAFNIVLTLGKIIKKRERNRYDNLVLNFSGDYGPLFH